MENWHCNIPAKTRQRYNDEGTYRPITLTSYIGLLLERKLDTRIRNHNEIDYLLPPFQHGFRKNYSTGTYLFPLLSFVEPHIKSKQKVAALSPDFQKAFDSFWLEGILYRFEDVGIPLRLEWFSEVFYAIEL